MELNDACSYNYARMLERKAGIPPTEERDLRHTSLCARCEHGVVYRRRDHLEVAAYCKTMLRHVPSDSAECTNFEQPNAIDLETMVEMALPVDAREGVNENSYL